MSGLPGGIDYAMLSLVKHGAPRLAPSRALPRPCRARLGTCARDSALTGCPPPQLAAGYMDSMTEKFWNTKINVWMRGPMCVVGAFIAYQSALESSFAAACAGDQCAAAAAGARMPAGQRAASLTTAVILLWNGQVRAACRGCARARREGRARALHGSRVLTLAPPPPRDPPASAQFFAERVIVNYGERSKQSTAEMYAGAAAGMLPRNLSKPSLKAMARNLSRDSLLQLAEASN